MSTEDLIVENPQSTLVWNYNTDFKVELAFPNEVPRKPLFTYKSGNHFIYHEGSDRCVTYDIHSASPGAILLPCMAQPGYAWDVTADGRLKSQALGGKCLTLTNEAPYFLLLEECSTGSPEEGDSKAMNQVFRFTEPPDGNG